MNTSKIAISDKLIVFTRYPLPGETKTRLIPSLGPVGAADVHRRLTENIVDEVKNIKNKGSINVEVCFTGGSVRQMKTWLGKDLLYSRQVSGDLGERMYSVINNSFSDGNSRVVLIGTDVPGPVSGHIEEAFYALEENDIVIGPSIDGGYWLLGMNKPCDLFHDIPWGQDTVLDRTVKRAEERGLKVSLLSPVSDIDTIDDLLKMNPDGDWCRPYLSVIIPALNEEGQIKKTIKMAMNIDAEVIVVDGGSVDKTVRIAESLGVKVIKSPRGRAVQQNAGALASRGNNLLFLHADTLVPINYPDLIFETLIDKRAVAGAFQFKTDMKSLVMSIIELIANIRSHYFKLPYGDQGIFLAKSDFIKAGTFPEVSIAEDLFFIRNIKKFANIKIAPAQAVTSARRWEKNGTLKTSFIHFIIMLGCYLGIHPEKLATYFRLDGHK